jgi:hypothetical protein
VVNASYLTEYTLIKNPGPPGWGLYGGLTTQLSENYTVTNFSKGPQKERMTDDEWIWKSKIYDDIKFEVLTVTLLKILIFCYMLLYQLANSYLQTVGLHCLHCLYLSSS